MQLFLTFKNKYTGTLWVECIGLVLNNVDINILFFSTGVNTVKIITSFCQSSAQAPKTPPIVPHVELKANMNVIARRKSMSWIQGEILDKVTKSKKKKEKCLFCNIPRQLDRLSVCWTRYATLRIVQVVASVHKTNLWNPLNIVHRKTQMENRLQGYLVKENVSQFNHI